ncbi:extracellular solute-binding protein [candidate division KSB1 bacterium]|nr:extracellular solute-binding protein [candidate division KSB1 bacterium]
MENSVKVFIYGLIIAIILVYMVLPEPRKGEINAETGEPRIAITFVGGGLGRDRLLFDEIERTFEKQHPNIDLKFIRSTTNRKVDTMISSGVSPDILNIGHDRVAYYLEVGALADLTPFIRDDPQLQRDLQAGGDFYEIMVEPFKTSDKIYMIPTWYTPFFIYYNKNLFDKYNIPYPDENWSWRDLREKAIALTHDTNGDGQPDEFGLHFAQWQHGIETFIMQNNGKIFSDDGERVDIENPKTVEALQFLYDLKFKDKVCPSQFATPGVSAGVAFVQGRIGMFGPWGVFSIVDFREQITDFEWDVAVLPRGPDGTRAGINAPSAFGVSSQCENKREAFEFVKFISSKQGMEIIAKWSLFIPCRKSVARSPAFLDPSTPPEHDELMLHDVEHGYAHLPAFASSRTFEIYEIVNNQIMSRLLDYNLQTPEETVHIIAEKARRVLERALPARVEGYGSVWPMVLPFSLLIIAIVFFIAYFRRRSAGIGRLGMKEARWGYLMISPWLIGFLLLTIGPILFSVGLSFCRWQSLASIGAVKFVGFENYATAFSGTDEKFYKSLFATFKYAFMAVPAAVIVGLLLAVLMNAKLKGITVFRTMYFIPSVVPVVASTVLWWYLFNPNHGWVNYLLAQVGIDGPNWLGDPQYTIIVLVLLSLWGIGGSMIIYLAGLQSIPSQLYEAAETDGAGALRQFWHVTLPMISPILFFNLVMGLIGAFQVFTQAFVMFNGGGGPDDSALFYVLHLYQLAIEKYELGYGSALAWILFVIILIFTLIVFKSSPLWVYYEGEKGK